jgi:hypothetical protein
MKKSYIGIALTSLSIGGLIYLYFGFLKPRQDVINEMEQETKKI